MPITITPTEPGGFIGLGLPIGLASDFIGPIPSGSTWSLGIGTNSSDIAPNMLFSIPVSGNPTVTRLPVRFVIAGALTTSWLTDGVAAHVDSKLIDNTNHVLDAGNTTIPWAGTQAVPEQLRQTTIPAGSGLTQEQAQQLSEVHASTFLDQVIDQLLTDDRGLGSSTQPVSGQLPAWIFAIVIRMTAVPEDVAPGTPDGDYWTPSLAVVRIFRGSDLWSRVPVHTSSKYIELAGEGIVSAVTSLPGFPWFADLSFQVTFRAGAEGRVLLLRHP